MKLLSGAVLMFVVVACAPMAEEAVVEEGLTVEEATAAFTRLLEQFDAAVSAGDADALATLYADEAVRMEPDLPAWVGNAAIRDGFAQTLGEGFGGEPGSWSVVNVFDDVIVAGEWVIARSSYVATFTPEGGGEPVFDTGKSMSLILHQPDCTSKIVWDIWNRDAPLVEQ